MTGYLETRINRPLGCACETRKKSASTLRQRARELVMLAITSALSPVMVSHPAFAQGVSVINPIGYLDDPAKLVKFEQLGSPTPNAKQPSPGAKNPADPDQSEVHGLVRRGVTRVLKDQEELYRAPFRRSSLKWDAIVLVGTGALIATDRHIEKHLPGGNVDVYTNVSNVALGGTASAVALLWGYGMKNHNEHLEEVGLLEAEAVVNSFLIYTPMQFVAGRQRPGEGNGYGDFWRHHNVNTSFPAGHPMFTMAMASVLAHEYPKPWVEVLAYGAAASVMGGRLLGRDHWSSDVFVGSALGYFIGARMFHLHCNPKFSPACHTH